MVLSYSSEGHVDLEDLVDALAPFGALDVHELGELGRYRPNLAASNAGSSVREFLLDLVKEEAGDLGGGLSTPDPSRRCSLPLSVALTRMSPRRS